MVALPILAGNPISGTANFYSLLKIQVDSFNSCLSSLFFLFIDVASSRTPCPLIKPLTE